MKESNPIIDEVRAIRDSIAEQYDYNIAKIAEAIRQLFEAFLGRVAYHFRSEIAAINAQFPEDPWSGLGKSTDEPEGSVWTPPRGIAVCGALKSGRTKAPRVGSGEGNVDVRLRLSGGNRARRAILPAGLIFISRNKEIQNGILVQDVTLSVQARTEQEWCVRTYCANHARCAAGEGAEFDLGPVRQGPAWRALFTLLEGKTIKRTTLVQTAVWEITDQHELQPKTRTTGPARHPCGVLR